MSAKTKEMSVVEKIHCEFDSANVELKKIIQDRKKNLEVDEAKAREASKKTKIYKELENIGFKSSKTVQSAQKVANKITAIVGGQQSLSTMEKAIEKIEKMFPDNKIISLKQMYKILDKYNLFVGDIRLFTGEIPEANGTEIVEFNEKFQSIVHKHDLTQNNHRDDLLLFQIEENYHNYSYKDFTLDYSIVAPLTDFNTDKREVIGSEFVYIEDVKKFSEIREELKQARRKYVEDPIVLMPVIVSGIMFCVIVTKWGPEAEMPEFKG